MGSLELDQHEILIQNQISKGIFNNYVDKMRRRRGEKLSVFVHAQGVKTGP